jgi:hypothetical protein
MTEQFLEMEGSWEEARELREQLRELEEQLGPEALEIADELHGPDANIPALKEWAKGVHSPRDRYWLGQILRIHEEIRKITEEALGRERARREAERGAEEAVERAVFKKKIVRGKWIVVSVLIGLCVLIAAFGGRDADLVALIGILIVAYFAARYGYVERPLTGPAEAPGTHSRHIPNAVKIAVSQRDGGVCAHCDGTDRLACDHIIPYSKGGAIDDVSNIHLLCRSCNTRKGNRFTG